MKSKNLLVFLLLLFVGSSLWAQQTVTGKVIDDDGQALIGANIIESGTANGTTTDLDGNYSIRVANDASLEFSLVGYKDQVIAVTGSTLNVTLSEGVELGEIVVTALGISREKKGLTYAVDEVSGDEVNTVKDANVINALSGKTPGLTIKKGSGGVGGSTRIVLRGNKSTTNNDPLYVIDGIPMTNNRSGQNAKVFGGNIDSGDGISNINPDDIESISVLKGASAAALYGSQAANGVILITTKKGVKGKPKVTVSSSYTSDKAIQLPELQFRYGQTTAGDKSSWGPKGTFDDHVSGFFNKGNTFINSFSVSGGSDNATSYFSYSNTKANGILPTNELNRHNVAFNQSMSFFDKKLELRGSVNYIKQEVKNRPAGGLYFNPLTGLYFLPRGLDFKDYTDNYEVYSQERNLNVQNWHADNHIQQNPWWILNRNQSFNNRDRYMTTLSASYKLMDGLKLQLRGNLDKTFDHFTNEIYASTQGTLADPNGRFRMNRINNTQVYGDALLMYNKQVNSDIALDVNVGMSHTLNNQYSFIVDSKDGGLSFANEFYIQNLLKPLLGRSLNEYTNREKKNAVFASAQVGYKSMLYFDVTGRNDWSSALPNTAYFYPSLGMTAIFTEMMDLSFLDYGKMRLSYAKVGNAVPAYLTNPRSQRGYIQNGNFIEPNTVIYNDIELVPEESASLEFGLDLKAINNKLGFNFTWYKTNTTNQFINIKAPIGSGASFWLVNAGDIANKGIEMALSYDVLKSDKLSWNTSFNYAKNTNEVIELHPRFDNQEDGPAAFYLSNEAANSYGMVLQKGGAFGDVWGVKFMRNDAGKIMLDTDGKPRKEPGLGFLGNPNPDFALGWSNSLSYQGVSLNFLIDGSFGGQVLSISNALMDELGVTEATAAARDAGKVEIDAVAADGSAVSSIDPQLYYSAVSGRNGITEAYLYDATNIRLRELSLGYKFPNRVMGTGIKLSLIGRNLMFFKNNAPFDPDITASTGVGLQGVDIFSLPSTRSFGVNLSLDF